MMEYKCRICGGKIKPGKGVVKCEHCNTEQAFPVLKHEQEKQYVKAVDHYRKNEFDQASSLFELIISEGNSDPAIFWHLFLCKYGIQYVYEPKRNEYVPTLFRKAFFPIEGEQYDAAMKYGSEEQKSLFKREADIIRDIQTETAALSATMECDIFISYKQTDDATNEPTMDSKRAKALYDELAKEGYKVFYAPESLKDRAGYFEPLIYAALHKAKFMIVIGTRPEYFNAPWVKNEWSRYLPICREGKGVLIPAYENMRPTDIPVQLREEYQAFCIYPLESFTSRAIRVVKSVQKADEVSPLLKAALEVLAMGEADEAEAFCKEELHNKNPNIGMVYMLRLMMDLGVKTPDGLGDLAKPIKGHRLYKLSHQFASPRLQRQLESTNKEIEDRIENEKNTRIYNEADRLMKEAKTEEEYRNAAKKFGEILGFNDASSLHAECMRLAEETRKEAIFQAALERMGKNTIAAYTDAIKGFNEILDYKESKSLAQQCRAGIETIKANTYKKAKSDLLKASSSKHHEAASSLLGTINGYEEADYLAKYSHKFAMFMSGYEGLADMMDNMYNGNIEGYDAAVKRMESMFGWNESPLVDQFRKWTMEQQKKNQIQEQNSSVVSVKKGEVIQFGRYPQGKNGEIGPIEWIVLDKEPGGTLLLISKYGLDCQPYNTEKKEVTWETCSLKQWLNKDFYEAAFNVEEKGMILDTKLANKDNPEYGTKGGNPTRDKVFLLSIEEAGKHFHNNVERQCKPTAYAKSQGAWSSSEGYCWWWLRSPGCESINAAIVDYDGSLYFLGDWVDSSGIAVRPSLRLHL